MKYKQVSIPPKFSTKDKEKNKQHVTTERLMEQALRLHKLSKLDEAQAMYETILRAEPHHADALHLLAMTYNARNQKDKALTLIRQALQIKQHPIYYNSLGVVLKAQGKFDEAIDAYKKALSLSPNDAGMHHNLGSALHAQGKIAEAITSYTQALAFNPNDAELHYTLGVALYDNHQVNNAITALNKAVSLNPSYTDAYYNLGVALQHSGRLDEAIKAYTKAVSLNPNYVVAYNNLGVSLYDKGQIDQAIKIFIKTLSLDPRYADAYFNLGNALQRQKKTHHAIEAFRKALALNPHYVDAYNNLGVALKAQGDIDKAIASYTQALVLDPHHAGVYNNLGSAFKSQDKIDKAIESYTQALSLDPTYIDAYNNLGNALYDQGRIDEAIQAYIKALSFNPNHADARWNHALALLISGNLVEGFKGYEYRWEVESSLKRFKRTFPKPLWLGKEDLNEKTIVIHSEQGLEDTLQFCRYIEILARKGAYVIFEVQKPLVRLLQNLKGVSRLIQTGDLLPSFDYHCPLLSLPHALKTSLETIPCPIPYIEATPMSIAFWKDTLGEKRAFRIGLVWSGGFRANQPELWHINNRRNIPFELIAKLNRANVDFYSLQKGEPAESEFKEHARTFWKSDNLFNYMSEVRDFADTAGLISQMDLILSVDTSTAHLAAAMGKPVWLFNRFDTCWRWMLHREDSPWYPSLRLFRQPSFGDWESVIKKMKECLDTVLASHSYM
ncbi:MAG: tetratricopeptide repeat protein [Sulfurospirillum cavolei]|nr:tetratricopeptide repeat protein [Sulfurospirillum cavolei]